MFRICLLLLLAALMASPSAAEDPVRATRTLRVGAIVAAGDLSTRAEDMIGLEVRRAIYAGAPVTSADLGPPTLVHRNEVVTMSFRTGGIDLRAEGRALGSGGGGETIEVMNLTSRRTVRAVITGARSVEVRK